MYKEFILICIPIFLVFLLYFCYKYREPLEVEFDSTSVNNVITTLLNNIKNSLSSIYDNLEDLETEMN